MFDSRKMRFAVNFVKKGKKYKAVFQISLAQCGGPFTVPKFAIRSQSEGVSTVLISCVIKPLPNMATLRRSQDFSKGWGGVTPWEGTHQIFFMSFSPPIVRLLLRKKGTPPSHAPAIISCPLGEFG